MTQCGNQAFTALALSFLDRGFIAIGLLFLTIGLIWCGVNLSWDEGTQTMLGHVIRMDASGRGGRGESPVVEYEVAGQASTVQGLNTNPPAYAVGDSIPVRYRVSNPADAVIDGFLNRWLLPMIFSLMGFGFTLANGIALWRRRTTSLQNS